MAVTTALPRPSQMVITLERGAMVSDIRKAVKLMRGVASVRMATIGDDRTITPALRRRIKRAREEYANGETISCRTPEDMQRYFESL